MIEMGKLGLLYYILLTISSELCRAEIGVLERPKESKVW